MNISIRWFLPAAFAASLFLGLGGCYHHDHDDNRDHDAAWHAQHDHDADHDRHDDDHHDDPH